MKDMDSEAKVREWTSETFRANQLIPAYCTYEKKNSMLRDPKAFKLKNGLPGIEGVCVSCAKRISRLGRLE